MDIAEAEQWLDGLINRERQPRVSYARFGLDAIEALLARMGNPERSLSAIHLAGSKGKGSTALLVEAVLLELGESVGTYTSPHLERWTERFRLDGRDVADEVMASVVNEIRPHVDAMRVADSRLWPSFFDATTAAAFRIFERADVDRAVLEVGLGGRLDSTNVVQPAATAVTSIEYEHTDKLGDTLAKIAGEKAGILKPGVPCVMGRLPSEAAKVVEERAANLGARLDRIDHEFSVTASPSGSDAQSIRIGFDDGFSFRTQLAAQGAHQADNAGLAVALVRALGVHDDDAIEAAARRALSRVRLPGRIEVVERDPWVIVDGAHTRESIRGLIAWLAPLRVARRRFVLSVALDKALDPILDLVLPLADEIVLTRAEPVRALDPQEVARRIRARDDRVELRVEEDPDVAVRSAREGLAADELLCVTGSVYLAGIARRVLVPR